MCCELLSAEEGQRKKGRGERSERETWTGREEPRNEERDGDTEKEGEMKREEESETEDTRGE